jgi:DHA2 family multidrug resistance protein
MITVVIMTAAFMTALDITIANVALPHMAGSVSASADQITWVLTSYIIAQAIMTPMSGWLAGRFGTKQVFMISVAGFGVASALCGAAQNLEQIVAFRTLQGVFGAAMAPLSQAVLLDIYSVEERGAAMALWGMGIMVAPITGPVLGGWLTDNLSWRWVFYINVPVGALCLLGLLSSMPPDRRDRKLPFDILGFSLLGIALASFQLFLDRGQSNDWFQSREVLIEAAVAAVSVVLFALHTVTVDRPFLPVELIADRNFVMATVLSLALGLVVFSMIALLPPMLETLLGYPVVSAGMVMAPRGVGSLTSMFLVGRLVGRVDNRVLIIGGLVMFAASFFGMSHFALNMGPSAVVLTGVVQGLGTGFVFTPISMLAFATLEPALRADGAGVFTLVRNLGNSAGISVMQAFYTRNVQVVHARLIERLTPDNPMARAPYLRAPYSLSNASGIAALNGEVTRQASMVAYIDVFHLMFLITLCVAPVVLLLSPSDSTAHEETLLVE